MKLVGTTGLEPARITPLDPKSSASANSATFPLLNVKLQSAPSSSDSKAKTPVAFANEGEQLSKKTAEPRSLLSGSVRGRSVGGRGWTGLILRLAAADQDDQQWHQ